MSGRLTHHGDLVFDVLSYAARLLAEGDQSTLMVMGFKPEQIRSIEALTLKSLHRAGELGSHFLDFRVDPACFERVMRRIEQEQADGELKDALLRAGAPIRMMHHYWGMTSRDCAERRRVLGVEAPIGRPSQAGEQALEQLWHLWQASDDQTDERLRYLHLAEASELPLSMIWIAVEEWKDEIVGAAAPRVAAGSATNEPVPERQSRVVELHR
jgi:hypothetical protein